MSSDTAVNGLVGFEIVFGVAVTTNAPPGFAGGLALPTSVFSRTATPPTLSFVASPAVTATAVHLTFVAGGGVIGQDVTAPSPVNTGLLCTTSLLPSVLSIAPT